MFLFYIIGASGNSTGKLLPSRISRSRSSLAPLYSGLLQYLEGGFGEFYSPVSAIAVSSSCPIRDSGKGCVFCVKVSNCCTIIKFS